MTTARAKTSLSVQDFQRAMLHVCDAIVAKEAYLTALDCQIGDGDHGHGMRDGFTSLRAVLRKTSFESFYEVTRMTGITLLRAMGGASGVLFCSLFTGGHEAVVGKQGLNASELIAFFEAGILAIAKRGRCKVGDKTMLDALLPALSAMKTEKQHTEDVREILKAAAEGAILGAQATEGMIPRLGRAMNFRQKALGLPDPGAVSVSIIMQGLYEGVQEER